MKAVRNGLFTSTHNKSPCIAWRLNRNGKLLKFLRILTTTMYFKDCTVLAVRWSVKQFFCSEFLHILDKAGRKPRRRRTQTIAKHSAFHTNAINPCISSFFWNTINLYTNLYFVITVNLRYIQNDICTSFILRPDWLYSKQGHLYFDNSRIIFFNSLSSFLKIHGL